ncbi:hypothetical protein [Acinetobacter phage vB_AbaS_TCUP2199]|nr:hypothetical protein [Acinetobacter phage vB_AbaS_TCUP2199]
MSNKPTIFGKYPVKDALSMIDEGIIDEFVWPVPNQKEAVYFRNYITQTALKYEGLKLKTNIVKAIIDESVVRYVHIQRADIAEEAEE